MAKNFKRETARKAISRQEAKDYHSAAILLEPTFDQVPIEAGLRGCPWRITVACILRANTDQIRARIILEKLLNRWTIPETLASAFEFELHEVVNLIHMSHRRSRQIHSFSQGWIKNDWNSMLDLPGVNSLALSAIDEYGGRFGQGVPEDGPVSSQEP